MITMWTRRRLLSKSLALSASAIAPQVTVSLAQAQSANWPNRPITIVSPYPPGGTNDIVARLFADRMSKALGQAVLVENKPGAAGIVGAQGVMRAANDGYTFLAGNNGGMIVQAVVKAQAPYDPASNFTPITKIADATNFIGVMGELPVNNIAELVAYSKKEAGKVFYSTTGSGSFGNFLGEYFKLQTGADLTHVPSRGAAAALTELMGGRIQVVIDPIVLTQRSSNRVKVLATISPQRVEAYPDIPTIIEAGGPALSIAGWFGLLGPANLPKDIVAKIEAIARSLGEDADARKAFATAGLRPAPMPSEAFTKLIRDDLRKYDDIKLRSKMVVE